MSLGGSASIISFRYYLWVPKNPGSRGIINICIIVHHRAETAVICQLTKAIYTEKFIISRTCFQLILLHLVRHGPELSFIIQIQALHLFRSEGPRANPAHDSDLTAGFIHSAITVQALG